MKIKSKQGYDIFIKEYIPEKIEKIIIACHGFGGDKNSSAIELLANNLLKENTMVVAFDFPAHGESKASDDRFTVENSINDLITVENYYREKYNKSEVGIFATSYGAYITLLKIQKYSNCYSKIVLRSPAICMDEIFENSILNENIEQFKIRGYSILGYERKMKIPYKYYEELKENKLFNIYTKNEKLLIIQGSEDDMAPISDSIEFIKEKNSKGKIIKILGADHRMKKEGELEKAIKYAVDYILDK